MTDFLAEFYDTEGPLGLPMKDRQARELEALVAALPEEDRVVRRAVVEKARTEVLDGERSDVSWISTEDVDRDREVVLASGMDDSHFKLNPIVTMQHAYWLPPVGRSAWRKRATDGGRVGVKAKTIYPARPAGWPADAEWPADGAFPLVQSGLLNGKSIGFLPKKSHAPDERERQRPGWGNVTRVIDEWVLLEYACVFLPAQQHAVVESVSKGLALPNHLRALLGELFDLDPASLLPREPPPLVVPFTPLEEVEKAVRRRVEGLDLKAFVDRAVAEAIDRLRGRV